MIQPIHLSAGCIISTVEEADVASNTDANKYKNNNESDQKTYVVLSKQLIETRSNLLQDAHQQLIHNVEVAKKDILTSHALKAIDQHRKQELQQYQQNKSDEFELSKIILLLLPHKEKIPRITHDKLTQQAFSLRSLQQKADSVPISKNNHLENWLTTSIQHLTEPNMVGSCRYLANHYYFIIHQQCTVDHGFSPEDSLGSITYNTRSNKVEAITLNHPPKNIKNNPLSATHLTLYHHYKDLLYCIHQAKSYNDNIIIGTSYGNFIIKRNFTFENSDLKSMQNLDESFNLEESNSYSGYTY